MSEPLLDLYRRAAREHAPASVNAMLLRYAREHERHTRRRWHLGSAAVAAAAALILVWFAQHPREDIELAQAHARNTQAVSDWLLSPAVPAAMPADTGEIAWSAQQCRAFPGLCVDSTSFSSPGA